MSINKISGWASLILPLIQTVKDLFEKTEKEKLLSDIKTYNKWLSNYSSYKSDGKKRRNMLSPEDHERLTRPLYDMLNEKYGGNYSLETNTNGVISLSSTASSLGLMEILDDSNVLDIDPFTKDNKLKTELALYQSSLERDNLSFEEKLKIRDKILDIKRELGMITPPKPGEDCISCSG